MLAPKIAALLVGGIAANRTTGVTMLERDAAGSVLPDWAVGEAVWDNGPRSRHKGEWDDPLRFYAA